MRQGETIRTFIAIELPDDIKQKLTSLQNRLKATVAARARWVSIDSFHLTLKFLGDIRVERVQEITDSIQMAAAGITAFTLEVKGTGVFPDVRRARAGWVWLGGDMAALIKLQKAIEANMETLSFPREERAFTPHLTLARVSEGVPPEERQQFGRAVTEAEFTGGSFKAEAVSLMKSQLSQSGSIYTRLRLVRLG